AARRAAPRSLACRLPPVRPESSAAYLPAIALCPDLSRGLPLQANHRQRGARRIAAFVLLLRARPQPGLRLIIHGNDTVADRQSARDRKVHQATGGLVRNDFEMDGVAANDATERDHAIVAASTSSGRIYGDGDRARDFQGPGHGDAIEFGASVFKDFAGACQE